MTTDGSITRWIGRLKDGDARAAQKIWEAYFEQLVPIAKKHMRGLLGRTSDEHDVVLSAFDSFYRGVDRGRFPELADRDDLWRLLVVITARKASDQRAYERRQKRGESVTSRDVDEGMLHDIISDGPTPEFAAEVADECQRLLGRLDGVGLRDIALWRMEGWTTEEIAEKLGCVPRTIERKLHLIRETWKNEEG